ncbi:MAG: alkaline phosphatase family protein [bacterium]
MSGKRLLFIEFDGASWEVMRPLLHQGKLPNIQKLMVRGVSGTLLSDFPLISPKLWVSIFTGKKPERHGVHFFGATSRTAQCKRIWDIFNEKGLRVGVFGTLVTWPPSAVNGFIIPSIFALGPDTHPEEYRPFQKFVLGERRGMKEGRRGEHLSDLVRLAFRLRSYGVRPRTFWCGLRDYLRARMKGHGYLDTYWRKATVHLKMSVDTFMHLYGVFKPHFSTFHIHLCDALSHRYWAFFEPERFPETDKREVKKYREVIPAAYVEADRAIGRIVSLADERTTVVVASDHGSTALTQALHPYLLKVERLSQLLGIEGEVLPARFGLDTFLYSQNRDRLETIAQIVGGTTLKETGQKVFDIECHPRYIILRISKGLRRTEMDRNASVDLGRFGTVRFSELFSQPEMKVSGIHHMEGVLIMAGPDIAKGARLMRPTIFDLTPTLLALMGCPPAKDMDGRVLTEALKDEFLKESPVRYIETYETPGVKGPTQAIDYPKVKERLKALGYL